MPALLADSMHHRLRLSPSSLAAAVLLLPGPFGTDRLGEALRHEVAGLEANGVVREGVLAPWAARQLMLVLAPDLHVEVVVVTSSGAVVTQVWARPDAALVGHIDRRGWVELDPLEPASLACTLWDIVGLVDRGDAMNGAQRPIDPVRLARFEQALASGDHPAASVLLDEGEGKSAEELAIMAALASPERRTWRIAAHWTSAAGPVQRWLSVLDAGRRGLWCSSGAFPDAGGDVPPLVPTTAADAWNRLVDTLPPGTAGAPPISPDDGPAHPGRAPCPMPPPLSPTASSDSSSPPAS
jgi:hypothetical protein